MVFFVIIYSTVSGSLFSPIFPLSLVHLSSRNRSSITEPLPSSAIAVNPQANLLSISIRRVARQLNIYTLAAQHVNSLSSLSLLPAFATQDACQYDLICPFVGFFFD